MTVHDQGRKKRLPHFCTPDAITDADESEIGSAIEICEEDADGHFHVSTKQHRTRVNFCPFCGLKAPTPCQYFISSNTHGQKEKMPAIATVTPIKKPRIKKHENVRN